MMERLDSPDCLVTSEVEKTSTHSHVMKNWFTGTYLEANTLWSFGKCLTENKEINMKIENKQLPTTG